MRTDETDLDYYSMETYEDNTVMTASERRAFKREQRAERAVQRALDRADRRKARTKAKTDRMLARNPGMREATTVVALATDGAWTDDTKLDAAMNVLDRIGRMRDRRACYVIAVGTWIAAITVALVAS